MADMDLTTYAGVKAAIAAFLARTDLAEQIPGFIVLAEADIRRRVRRKTVRSTVTLTSDTFPVPADCAEIRSLRLVTSEKSRDLPLTQQTPVQLDERRAATNGTSGRPRFYAVVGSQILFDRAPGAATQVELRYFEKNISLSSQVASNSILLDSPDVYLYGALIHSAPYLMNDERVALWKGMYNDAIASLDTARMAEENAGAPQTARLPVHF